MNRKNYLYMSDGLNILNIKISANLDKSSEEAKQDVLFPTINNIDLQTILHNDFYTKDSTAESALFADYYYQTLGTEGTFSIYKKTPMQKYYTYVCELSKKYDFVDYNITNNSHYHYLVAFRFNVDGTYKIYQNVIDGAPIYIDTKWDNWSICNIKETEDENIYQKTGDIWFLRYNLSAGEIVSNNSVTTWDTLGQFPKFSVGQKNYQGSNISCMLGDIVRHQVRTTKKTANGTTEKVKEVCGYTEKINVNNKYAREVEKFEAWKEFITDGELKLLKDIKGNSWVVQVSANPASTIDTISNLQQTMVSFSWQEALDVNSISIVSNADL